MRGRWDAGIATVAALLGAAGVALAALAAHGGGHPSLSTAATFLILHGVGALALIAVSQSAAAPRVYLAAATAMVIGVALFSGDLSHRAFVGDRLFPFAAPLGGSLTIGAWLIAAVAGLIDVVTKRG